MISTSHIKNLPATHKTLRWELENVTLKGFYDQNKTLAKIGVENFLTCFTVYI